MPWVKIKSSICIKKRTNRQWCFRRPSQNSVWQLVHRDTAWSGTHKTLADIALFVELAPDEGGPLRSSTASQEQIETFSTPLSTVEFYKNVEQKMQIHLVSYCCFSFYKIYSFINHKQKKIDPCLIRKYWKVSKKLEVSKFTNSLSTRDRDWSK